jgi:hypothetical protein
MACDISRGKNELACKNAISGLKALYLANYDDYGFVTTSTSGSGQVMTSTGSLDEVFKYELKNSGNTFNQDIVSNRDTGTTHFTQTANFVLTKISAEMEFQVKMMAWGRPQIFVEMNSGQMFIMGKDRGCEISGKSEVGGALDSLNGYTLTAVAMENEPIFFLDTNTIASVKGAVAVDNITD